MEIWKRVLDEPRPVEVSTLGRVRTLDYVAVSTRLGIANTQLRRGRVISPYYHEAGYLQLRIGANSRKKKYYVHRLVAMAFCDGYDPSLTVNHKDGDKENNRPENLEWVTKVDNSRHEWATGLVDLRGENQPNSILKEHQIKEICDRRRSGESARSIAIEYGVSVENIYKILSGKGWAHVERNA